MWVKYFKHVVLISPVMMPKTKRPTESLELCIAIPRLLVEGELTS